MGEPQRGQIADELRSDMSTFQIKPHTDFAHTNTGAFADMPFDVYKAADGINKSGLDTLRDNPRKFKLQQAGEIVRDSTPALEWGTLVHEQILFGQAEYHIRPDTYGDGKKWSGNANECKAWLAAHEDKPVLTTKQADELRWQADAVLEHEQAAQLLRGGSAELSLFARDEERGFMMKARLDYFAQNLGAPYFLDIKTTLDASTRTLQREILNRRYHVQFALYRRILERLGVAEPTCYIIALEKGDLPRCQVRQISQAAIDKGNADLDADLALYWTCRTNDWWPDFADEERDASGIKAIDLPEYAYGKAEDLIGMSEGE